MSIKHGIEVAEGRQKFVPMENPDFSDFYITNRKSPVDLLICIGSDMRKIPQLMDLDCPKVLIA